MTTVRSTSRPPRPPDRPRPPAIRWNFWNVLLLVPLVVLFTPLYNRVEPRLFGIPFFYWFQFAILFVGIAVTWLVYLLTRDEFVVTDRPDRLDVDALDEGAVR